jgi:hypothetical protein
MLPLTRGKFSVLDEEDAMWAQDLLWVYNPARSGYAQRTDVSNGRRTVSLHEAIAARAGIHGQEIDHVNGNGLDNRRQNLRSANRLQNSRNKAVYKNNTSGHRGVWYDSRVKRWRAHIRLHGTLIHLGCFRSIEEAVGARLRAEHEYFQEFSPDLCRP